MKDKRRVSAKYIPNEQEEVRLLFDCFCEPIFFDHIRHLLYGGVVVIACEVVQDAKCSDFATSVIELELSQLMVHREVLTFW